MYFYLTSNELTLQQMKSENDYLFSLLHLTQSYVTSKPVTYYHFDLFGDTSQHLSDFYQSQDDLQFTFHSDDNPYKALDLIANHIHKRELVELQKDDDLQDEITVVVCCDYDSTSHITRYLNTQLQDLGSEITCINLYRYLKIPSTDRLYTMLTTALNIPVTSGGAPETGFALAKAIGGLL